nr:GNAT family N-acetyltransferase [uncultured Flavobacterium sp.]
MTTSTNLSIVEIRPNEFASVESIIRESQLIDDLLSIDQAIGFIKSKLDRNKVKIFAFKNKQNHYVAFVVLVAVVDCYSVVKYNWHISYLYVQKEYRRNKIALQLMQKCIEYSIYTRVNFLTLNTGVRNTSAQKLYQSLGFEKRGFLASYYYYQLNIFDLSANNP